MIVYLVWYGDRYDMRLKAIFSDLGVAIDFAKAEYDKPDNYDRYVVVQGEVDSYPPNQHRIWDSEDDA